MAKPLIASAIYVTGVMIWLYIEHPSAFKVVLCALSSFALLLYVIAEAGHAVADAREKQYAASRLDVPDQVTTVEDMKASEREWQLHHGKMMEVVNEEEIAAVKEKIRQAVSGEVELEIVE